MRISDWSSDVCSSDLAGRGPGVERPARHVAAHGHRPLRPRGHAGPRRRLAHRGQRVGPRERCAPEPAVTTPRERLFLATYRSDELCVGKECVSKFSSRSLRSHTKSKLNYTNNP